MNKILVEMNMSEYDKYRDYLKRKSVYAEVHDHRNPNVYKFLSRDETILELHVLNRELTDRFGKIMDELWELRDFKKEINKKSWWKIK